MARVCRWCQWHSGSALRLWPVPRCSNIIISCETNEEKRKTIYIYSTKRLPPWNFSLFPLSFDIHSQIIYDHFGILVSVSRALHSFLAWLSIPRNRRWRNWDSYYCGIMQQFDDLRNQSGNCRACEVKLKVKRRWALDVWIWTVELIQHRKKNEKSAQMHSGVSPSVEWMYSREWKSWREWERERKCASSIDSEDDALG